ncbi:MAG: FIST N-terminal domain-containing protein [Verrucomicrobiota bacterium]
MQTTTAHWKKETGWTLPLAPASAPQLVLYFGATSQLEEDAPAVRELVERFPQAVVCGCSTAGEILGSRVFDDSIAAALVHFDSTRVRAVVHSTKDYKDSLVIGRLSGKALMSPDLRHVLVLSDGLSVNGTALVSGLREVLPANVAITGGLAGDGSRFQKTFVGLGSDVRQDQVVAVGFYGPNIVVGYGSRGGWEGFGPRRRITRSKDNTLFELDNQPALALYKRYLGERAAGLPATGLLFPLELTADNSDKTGLVRTILAVDEAQQSLTFAGDMPEGWYARLMKATGDQLVDGAAGAGTLATSQSPPAGAALAVLVSCVGRRLVLGQRIEEEVEAVVNSLPKETETVGFYSYGEACPSGGTEFSELHNQTMTITVLSEKS